MNPILVILSILAIIIISTFFPGFSFFWKFFYQKKEPTEIHDKYDVIIRVDRLLDLLSQGWEFDTPGNNAEDLLNGEWEGKCFGVMGLFNRGKTFVLGNISQQDFAQGILDDGKTEGLSIKFVEKNQGDHKNVNIILDVAGLNRPIEFVPKEGHSDHMQLQEMIQESETLEKLLNDLVVELSDVLIIVVNQLTRLDQDFILKVSEAWKNRHNKIIIVHNLRGMNEGDATSLWRKSMSFQGGYIEKLFDEERKTEYYEHNVHGSHLRIADSNSEWGKQQNKKTFGSIKSYLESARRENEHKNLKEVFETAFSKCIRRHYRGVKNVILQNSQDQPDKWFLTIEAVENGKPKPHYQTFSDMWGADKDFLPNVIYEESEDSKQFFVTMEIPNLSPEDEKSIKIEIPEPKYPGKWSVIVSGEKPGYHCENRKLLDGHAESKKFWNEVFLPVFYNPTPTISIANGCLILQFDSLELKQVKQTTSSSWTNNSGGNQLG